MTDHADLRRLAEQTPYVNGNITVKRLDLLALLDSEKDARLALQVARTINDEQASRVEGLEEGLEESAIAVHVAEDHAMDPSQSSWRQCEDSSCVAARALLEPEAGPAAPCEVPTPGGWTLCGKERPCPDHDEPSAGPEGAKPSTSADVEVSDE